MKSPILAESEGFEPPEVLPSTVFKTAAIDHSANSPGAKVHFAIVVQNFFLSFLWQWLYKYIFFTLPL